MRFAPPEIEVHFRHDRQQPDRAGRAGAAADSARGRATRSSVQPARGSARCRSRSTGSAGHETTNTIQPSLSTSSTGISSMARRHVHLLMGVALVLFALAFAPVMARASERPRADAKRTHDSRQGLLQGAGRARRRDVRQGLRACHDPAKKTPDKTPGPPLVGSELDVRRELEGPHDRRDFHDDPDNDAERRLGGPDRKRHRGSRGTHSSGQRLSRWSRSR